MPPFKVTIYRLLALIGLLLSALPATASAGSVFDAPTVDVWPEGRMPGRGAKEPEADRPSKGDNVRRIRRL
ncbi:MAG TPA: hypothetical protein VF297_30330 [Pyrinomonadaceae bacterium]